MLLMRAWGSRAGPADAHDARPLGASVATQKTTKKKTVHRRHAGVGGTGVRPNPAPAPPVVQGGARVALKR